MATLTLPGADIRGYYQQARDPAPRTPVHRGLRAVLRGSRSAPPRRPRPVLLDQRRQRRVEMPRLRRARRRVRRRIAKGHTPRTAIDLMIAHGLIERRARLQTARELLSAAARPSQPAARSHARTRARARPRERPALQVTDQDIARWQTALSRRPSLLATLARERGWRYETIRALELGLDRGRITIPIRDARGELQGLLRYQPQPTGRPKMLFALGSRVGLIPHPTAEASERILLVEGPPDMIAARSRGLPAIAVPGDHAWQPAWARPPGRPPGHDRHGRRHARPSGRPSNRRRPRRPRQPRIVDLAPLRDDGYDLTDWLLDHPEHVDVDTLATRTPVINRAANHERHRHQKPRRLHPTSLGRCARGRARRARLRGLARHRPRTGRERARSSDAITAGRPGSWEADLVQQLINGTVGYDEEFLTDYGGPLR